MRDETPSQSGSVLVQRSCHAEYDEHISSLDVFYEKDGRENRCIRDVLEWYRGEDAGDLERIELNILVENWRYLSDPGRKIWKINSKVLMEEKSWKTLKSNQKVVMDEELVQNGVMDEKIVKNFVMGAKIDPKVVMDLSVNKIGGWNILHQEIENCLKNLSMRMNRDCRSEFQVEIHSLRYSTWNGLFCV